MDITEQMKALSDETRLRILNIVMEKELCVCDITESLAITQTKASRHLGVLRSAGLVTDRKSAQWVYYSIPEELRGGYLNHLIQGELRNQILYIEDLEHLSEWLARKNINCT